MVKKMYVGVIVVTAAVLLVAGLGSYDYASSSNNQDTHIQDQKGGSDLGSDNNNGNNNNKISNSILQTTTDPNTTQADVIMPTKSSRPGCEETDACYIPTIITIDAGMNVTWINEDSAFHSVTSGLYDQPIDTFDSGYMDPYDAYTLTFEQPGTFDYFCTLHPWMKGQVIVK